MTIEEALADIEKLGRGGLSRRSVAEQEVSWRDTLQAVRLLAEAYEHLRKRDHLYADRRRASLVCRPRVCRQADASRAGADYSAARGRVHGTVPACQHVFGGLRTGA